MSRALCFLAGLAVASIGPAVAADVRLQCQPVIVPVLKCDPTALRYNRASMECHRA